MSTNKRDNIAFTANLYVNGLPVVLNQQRLKQRLRDSRITQSEKLDVEVALADLRESSFITLADHEDDKPLLLKFTPQGDSYAINVVLRGMNDGARLIIESNTHNLLVSQNEQSEFFSISKSAVMRARLSDLESGPTYIGLASESNKKPLYRDTVNRMDIFKSVDPNVTGHIAYNNKPVVFVFKLIDKLPVEA
ncbi:hypothetical protein JFT86_10520 [Pseudomonas sp. TH06]|uniref:hypothetical protein n=2 Tax=unclassified Pseudomonas TaxID=196821 RepID=UPI001913365F|nr:hypothetical protein [Pseudomonas sp. TH06]MBK5527381.1 hypothetical protein [Pseudomonas sp. TH06]